MDNQIKPEILKYFLGLLEKWEKDSPPVWRGALYIVGIIMFFVLVSSAFFISVLDLLAELTIFTVFLFTIMFVIHGVNYMKTRESQISRKLEKVRKLMQSFISPNLKRRERISIVRNILNELIILLTDLKQQDEFKNKIRILDELVTEMQDEIIPDWSNWQEAGEWFRNNQKSLVQVAVNDLKKSMPENDRGSFEQSLCAHFEWMLKNLEAASFFETLSISKIDPRLPNQRDAYLKGFSAIKIEISKRGDNGLSPQKAEILSKFLDVIISKYE
jgi:hypothetical protein